MEENFKSTFKDKFNSYKNTKNAKEWLNKNLFRVKSVFENISLRDYIFEPFKDVFKTQGSSKEADIKSVITIVAVSNMVLAGLPGKMLGGVAVSMALEAWMAFVIAKSIGIKIESVKDIWKYFGALAGISLIIFEGFRQLLGLAFSLFSIIPFLNPMILAELFVTDLVGIIFWFGFEELKTKGSFNVPLKSVKSIFSKAKAIFKYQVRIIKNTLNKDTLKLVGKRLWAWLNGDIIKDYREINGELFHFAAMIHLIKGEFNELSGPIGEIFIKSIKRGYSTKLGDASLEEMSDFFSNRTPDQLKRDINLVKGEMYEHLIEHYENADGDEWIAKLHSDRNDDSGSDVIFTNTETGEQLGYQLKTTISKAHIDTHFKKYPDTPVITTSEMEEYFGDNPLVDFSLSDGEMQNVTAENFKDLIDKLEPLDVAASGATAKALGMLWPFTMAYIRKKISKEQLEEAYVKVLGESGKTLVSRLAWAIVLGPVFAWYLLSRSVIFIVRGAESLANKKVLIYNN